MSLNTHQSRTSNCTWLDINTQWGQNLNPELLPDSQSVLYSSFFNLMNCPVGARGRIFQPTYGSNLLWFIHQPINESTAQQIKMSIMTTFGNWEPRLQLDYNNTLVIPDYNLPGYRIRLSGTFYIGKEYVSVDFQLTK